MASRYQIPLLARRLVGTLLGLAVFGVVLALPCPDGMTLEAQRCAGVAALMAIWWLGRVFPMAVTALVPLLAFPALGITDIKTAAAPFAHPLNFLMLGGFVMGHAIEEVGLHRRVTSALLAPAYIRKRPKLVLLALMVAAAGLSGLVSNTATMVMMLPIALALAARVSTTAGPAFAMALAYACSIGGVSTLIGTPPNAVLAGLVDISFAEWMRFGVPFVLLALPAAWLVVSRLALPRVEGEVERPEAGPRLPGLYAVISVVALAMVAWLTRRGLGPIPAWGEHLHDAWIAVGAAFILFLVPHPERRFLLRWVRVERAIPWSVLLLLGGGFSLAKGVETSGLTAYLATFTAQLATLPPWLAVAALALGITFLTELTSNTATTQIVLPLLLAGATLAGVDPLLWMVPATMSASCAFMMPVATAPNAIACEAGGVQAPTLARTGLALNLVCVGIVVFLAQVFAA